MYSIIINFTFSELINQCSRFKVKLEVPFNYCDTSNSANHQNGVREIILIRLKLSETSPGMGI